MAHPHPAQPAAPAADDRTAVTGAGAAAGAAQPAEAGATAAGTPVETMNIVIVGHVDHGKSTVVGRLLHDTGSLPEGKIEQVRRNCARAGKPFEYAFLIDALRDEQAQGITIDSARVFFHSERRRYIIIDAPGHIEFLKNMISGAARAEAAILVIDAQEGVRENSRRHGYMAAMLGISQLVVVVNKMDLVDYDASVFERIRAEYQAFLHDIDVQPLAFIPVSGREGDNVASASTRTGWYTGPALLPLIDSLPAAGAPQTQTLRLPVQDVYKFPVRGDDARIIAGTIASGTIQVGDTVEFSPSRKRSVVRGIEGFNVGAPTTAGAGQATGITLEEELYVRPGELLHRVGEPPPRIGTTVRANVFWLGRNPLVTGKRYKLKLATAQSPMQVKQILRVLDAATLRNDADKQHVARHDVAECLFETHKPLAFDLHAEHAPTGRFVIVDDYEIAGGGIITEYVAGLKSSLREHVKRRDYGWVRGSISAAERVERLGQRPRLIVLTGEPEPAEHAAAADDTLIKLARAVERDLFGDGRSAYYLGLANLAGGLDSDVAAGQDRVEHIRRLGEVAHILTDAGQILITTVAGLDAYEAEILRVLNEPIDMLVIRVGGDQQGVAADLVLPAGEETAAAVTRIRHLLREREVLLEYYL